MKRILIKIKHKESRQKIVNGLIQMLLFDVSMFFLWYLYILPHELYSSRSLLVCFVAIGLLPIVKLIISLKLMITLEDVEANKVNRLNDELLYKIKGKATADLNMIKNLYKAGNQEEAIKYIDDAFSLESNDDYYTDCLTLNVMINHYKSMLEHGPIVFEFEVPKTLKQINVTANITRKSLNTILGNFIDNAIEAHRVSSDGDKRIKLSVDVTSDIVSYEVSNNADEIKDVTKIFEARYSTKGKNRGFGLLAVERASEMIGGVLEVQSTPKETSFRVVVNR